MTAPLDAHYYLGAGNRGGIEREFVAEETYGVTAKGNGDAFIAKETHTSLSTGGGEPGQGYPCVMTEKPEPCAHDGAPAVCAEKTVYGSSSYDSNAMKSNNPHSGFYEADTSRTLDLNGGNPACNQGGMMIVESAAENDSKADGQSERPVYDSYGFKPGQGEKARGIGWESERSPTLSQTEVAALIEKKNE